MESLKILMNEKLEIKPSSCHAYANSINNICNRWESQGQISGKKNQGFGKDKSFRFDKLAKPNMVLELLKDLKPSAQKNKMNALITVLKCIDSSKYAKAIKAYQTHRDQLSSTIKTEYNKSQRSEKQNENWASLDDLQKAVKLWQDEYDRLLGDKNTTELDLQRIANKLTCAVLYSGMYIAPVRLDMSNVEIITKKAYDKMPVKQGNYIILKPENSFFSLNDYKTSRKYGENKFVIPKELADVLRTIQKKSMNKGLLFPNPSNKTECVDKKNRFGELLAETFQHTGKKIYSSLLRNIYVTEKWNTLKTQQDREDLVKQMATSCDVCLQVYQKYINDEPIEDLTEESEETV